MRIAEPTLNMFLSTITEIEELRWRVTEAGEEWLKAKKQYGQQSWVTKDWREKLERCLWDYKKKLSEVYDLMHDRGLSNFESGRIERETPMYHPLVELPSEEEEHIQLLEFARLIDEGRSVGTPFYVCDGDQRPTRESGGTEGTRDEASATDFQSSPIASTIDGSKAKEEVSDDWTATTEFEIQHG
jgi:hypothetical protein